jgi:hypothetical protein
MATSNKIFSLEGKGLKLDTAADLAPHIESLRSMSDVEEVHLQGNTLGVEACKALGEVLETKKSLQVNILLPEEKSVTGIIEKWSFVDVISGCQLRRYIHWAPAERDPSSSIISPYRIINSTEPPYCQPER